MDAIHPNHEQLVKNIEQIRPLLPTATLSEAAYDEFAHIMCITGCACTGVCSFISEYFDESLSCEQC